MSRFKDPFSPLPTIARAPGARLGGRCATPICARLVPSVAHCALRVGRKVADEPSS
jgi:hypothetical protein